DGDVLTRHGWVLEADPALLRAPRHEVARPQRVRCRKSWVLHIPSGRLKPPVEEVVRLRLTIPVEQADGAADDVLSKLLGLLPRRRCHREPGELNLPASG